MKNRIQYKKTKKMIGIAVQKWVEEDGEDVEYYNIDVGNWRNETKNNIGNGESYLFIYDDANRDRILKKFSNFENNDDLTFDDIDNDILTNMVENGNAQVYKGRLRNFK